MTRTPLFAFILISILLTCSCSKSNNDTPTPTPPVDTTTLVKPDTLTAGWSKIKVPSGSLSDVFFNSITNGYTVGGYVFKTTDGGISWSKMPDSFPGYNIANIAVTPDGKLFLAATPTNIFSSTNGGASFSSTTIGNGVYDVFFVDNNIGYTTNKSNLFQTTDGGVSWAVVFPTTGLPFTPSGSNSFGALSIFFTNDSTGWIHLNGALYKTNGNLHNWVQCNFSVTGSQPVIIVSPVSTSLVYAVGNGNIFKSVDGGLNFNSIYSLPVVSGGYPDIHFIDANTGYVNWGNRIYKTTNGGTSWTPVVSLGGSSYIVEIHFTDANHGWGCTTDGYILRYSL